MDTGPSRTADDALTRRARMHAALGEPVRLAIVERLRLTDASPGELGAAFGLPTNLLAHHLKVLAEAGLVRRIRSAGDARRAYIQLRRGDPAVAALLPGTGPAVAPAPAARNAPVRVLFVCTHNSARSQFAAAAWKRISSLPVASAGTHPAGRIHPRTVTVGRRHGLRLGAARTTRLGDVARDGDLVVAVCDHAHEELATAEAPTASLVRDRLHWAVPDPAPIDTDAAFETAYTQISDRVGELAGTLSP